MYSSEKIENNTTKNDQSISPVPSSSSIFQVGSGSSPQTNFDMVLKRGGLDDESGDALGRVKWKTTVSFRNQYRSIP